MNDKSVPCCSASYLMLQTKKFAHPSVCCSYHKNISSWNGNLFASKILTPQVRQWHSRNLQNNFTIPVQTNSQKHCKPASEAISLLFRTEEPFEDVWPNLLVYFRIIRYRVTFAPIRKLPFKWQNHNFKERNLLYRP